MRIVITLFIFGVVIATTAFFINQMDNIPFVVKLISPKYARSSKGLDKLDSSGVLMPSDEGFMEFQEIFLNFLCEQTSPEKTISISVKKFQRSRAIINLSPIKVFISNGQEINWSYEDLIKNIENFKKKNTFVTSFIIFLFGVIIQIIVFFIGLYIKT